MHAETGNPKDHDPSGDNHVIAADCPLSCLAFHLSAVAYNALRRELPWLLKRPVTVADVVNMHMRRELQHIRHLGPRRISEIELVLTLAGLLAPHNDPPRDPPSTADVSHRT